VWGRAGDRQGRHQWRSHRPARGRDLRSIIRRRGSRAVASRPARTASRRCAWPSLFEGEREREESAFSRTSGRRNLTRSSPGPPARGILDCGSRDRPASCEDPSADDLLSLLVANGRARHDRETHHRIRARRRRSRRGGEARRQKCRTPRRGTSSSPPNTSRRA